MAWTGVGQTVLEYGHENGSGLQLFRCTTPRIRQTPVMDKSGTDLKCWRHEITVTGYVYGKDALRCFHKNFEGANDNTLVDGSAALAHKQFRFGLVPRLTLIIRTGVIDTSNSQSGERLYYVIPAYTMFPEDDPGQVATRVERLRNVDVNDGPVCHECSILHVSSDNMFRVSVTFIVHILECTYDGGTPSKNNGVLSNRWSCADHLDVNLRATRIYDGVLELVSAQFSPHWFRSLVLPTLGRGFRRDAMTFVASADGKTLQWQVVDQAIAVAAPYPARSWSVEHTEGTLPQDGLKSLGSLHITLTGDNDVNVAELIMLGMHIVSAKLLLQPLGGVPPVGGGPPVALTTCALTDLTITELIGDENVVRISASVQRSGGNVLKGTSLNMDSLAKRIESTDLPVFVNITDQYDDKISYGARAAERDKPFYKGPEDLIGIFRCFLQSPCNDEHNTNNTQNSQTNQLGTDYNPVPLLAPPPPPAPPAPAAALVPTVTTAFVATTTLLGTEPNTTYSLDHTKKMYRFYQCESHYTKKTLRAAMPLAIGDEGPDNDPKVTTKFVKLGGSQGRRVVRLHSERVGDWPQFPDPEKFDGLSCVKLASGSMVGSSRDIKMGLMSSKIVPGTRTLTSTGETIYRAMMEMRFVLSRCPRPEEVLNVGVDVWGKVGPMTTASSDITALQSPLTGDKTATNDTRTPPPPPPTA